jgi:predicted DCC family thiol-disulfide oxidoreductase YuxK
MNEPSRHESDDREARHLLLYDGECALCNASVRFVRARDRRGRFGFASLQSGEAGARLASFGVRVAAESDDRDSPGTFYVIEDAEAGRPRLHDRSSAALFVARELGLPWSAASVLALLPRAWRDRLYDVVARHRRSFFG